MSLMTEQELQEEMYREQMFGRRANGLPTIPFKQWQEAQAMRRRLLSELDKTPVKKS